MKRILCLISCMNTGGAETFLMKIYRALDKSKYQMDFCMNQPEENFYEKEILEMGGYIYRIPAKSQNLKEFKKQLAAIVKDNDYKYVLRVTSSDMGFMDLKIAKKAGAEICAARSSNSSDGGGIKAFIAHRLGRLLYSKYVDIKIAPSDLAAEYTFGKKAVKNGQVHIVNNALDLNVFYYDNEGRNKIRQEFGIDEKTFIVGHVGRFMLQKNHTFLIDIFEQIHIKNPNSVLMLVGKGELEQTLKEKIESLGLSNAVIFTGVRSDIPQLLSAMDVFVFPSFYEGMPNTVIEAQATALPCVVADTITKEAKITELVTYLPLTASSSAWAKCALQASSKERLLSTKEAFIKNGYEIKEVTQQLINLLTNERKLHI